MALQQFSFEQHLGTRPVSDLLPVTYHHEGPSAGTIIKLRQSRDSVHEFYTSDLEVDKLNAMHKHLYLAGLRHPTRPLHKQLAIGRTIVVTERADLHMLWAGDKIFMKPCPEYLLETFFWTDTKQQQHGELRRLALGFLLSYVWLVCHRSDFEVAQAQHLLPASLEWSQWLKIVSSLVTDLGSTDDVAGEGEGMINPRYRFGELRLTRVDLLYRLLARPHSAETLLRGYFSVYHTYSAFLQHNLAWLLTTLAYVALVLNAMQVGLTTERLNGNGAFQAASYGFAVLSILGPLIVLAALMLLTLVLVLFNWRFALSQRDKAPLTIREPSTKKSESA